VSQRESGRQQEQQQDQEQEQEQEQQKQQHLMTPYESKPNATLTHIF